jgi:hypothetical protein
LNTPSSVQTNGEIEVDAQNLEGLVRLVKVQDHTDEAARMDNALSNM